MKLRVTSLLSAFAILVGCAEEVPPPSVHEFLDDPIALEAALVRCSANRAETRYEAECVNARQAISIISAKEERERRARFEAESERKRAALRRTQQAAAEARRRAEAAEKRRKEGEYLAQFGELPPREDGREPVDEAVINAPAAIVPVAPEEQDLFSGAILFRDSLDNFQPDTSNILAFIPAGFTDYIRKNFFAKTPWILMIC